MKPQTITIFVRLPNAPKGGRSAAMRKGLMFLDSYLYLTQYSKINELAQGPGRKCSLSQNECASKIVRIHSHSKLHHPTPDALHRCSTHIYLMITQLNYFIYIIFNQVKFILLGFICRKHKFYNNYDFSLCYTAFWSATG